MSFPVLLPSLVVAELLYEEFKLNYRMLGKWHLNHRRSTLEAVLREDMKKAFRSVTGDAKLCCDRFEESTSVQILAVDEQPLQVHVDRDLPTSAQALWTVDDVSAQSVIAPSFSEEMTAPTTSGRVMLNLAFASL